MRIKDGEFMCVIWSLCGVLMIYGETPLGAHAKKSEHSTLLTDIGTYILLA